MRTLPPGQSLTRKFPVVGEKSPAVWPVDLDIWRLEVSGLVARPLQLTWPDYLDLPHRERTIDIHCVTGWSRLGTRFLGLPLAHLLARAEPRPTARFVRFESISPRRHDTSLPLDVATADTWLVHEVDGLPLEREHGYPLRTVTPSRYFYKSLKWVHRIELLAEDRLGFWERESRYHNVGDPWAGDQRFTTGSIEPRALERFRQATDFSPWRKSRAVGLGLDLRGWQPRSLDLSALQLKLCDLRGAQLAGADLRRANLSLCDLREANLSAADLRDADVEGADFSGADLRGADLSGAALSATKFFSDTEAGARAAVVSGLRWEGASGLLEDQEDYLRRNT
jgi:DMSO/TMAO reductase YedYZ molybdopterin-dependent catalytic subunit